MPGCFPMEKKLKRFPKNLKVEVAGVQQEARSQFHNLQAQCGQHEVTWKEESDKYYYQNNQVAKLQADIIALKLENARVESEAKATHTQPHQQFSEKVQGLEAPILNLQKSVVELRGSKTRLDHPAGPSSSQGSGFTGEASSSTTPFLDPPVQMRGPQPFVRVQSVPEPETVLRDPPRGPHGNTIPIEIPPMGSSPPSFRFAPHL